MFSRKQLMALATSGVACLSASCVDLTLPRFDGGLLNPEIRFLRAGEIMEGVKCAMVAFMHERETMLMKKRVEEEVGGFNHQIERDDFTPQQLHTLQLKKSYPQSIFKETKIRCQRGQHYGYDFKTPHFVETYTKNGKVKRLVPTCVANNCDKELEYPEAESLGESVWDHELAWTGNSVKEKGCVPVPDYSRFALDPTQSTNIQLTLTGANSGYINYLRIDALRTPFYPFIQPGNTATGFPFPTLQITPKGTTIFDMAAVMPQSIHTYQQSAHPSDVVARAPELDRVRLESKRSLESEEPAEKGQDRDKLSKLISQIRSQNSQIISLMEEIERYVISGDNANAKKKKAPDRDETLAQYKKTLTAQIAAAQSSCAKAMVLVFAPEDGQALNVAKDLQQVNAVCKRPAKEELADGSTVPTLLDVAARFAAGIPEKQKPGHQRNEFRQQCRVDLWSYHPDASTRIDYLALKKILNRVIEEQEARVYAGIPDVTLSSLNLTSSFQITLEASAGTTHFFRIVPLLAPPTTDIKFDHTHMLKITLNGKKNKGDKGLSKKLYDSCRERVVANSGRSVGGADEPVDFCASEAGQLLEAIVQAVEKGGSSPAGQ